MSKNIQPDLFNQEIVQEKQGELLVSSIVIAENVSYEHRNIVQLINTYKNKFDEFRPLHLECIGRNGTSDYKTWYELNENQTTFLFTLMRNNDLIVDFKFNLTKAFSLMKQKLAQSSFIIPTTFSEALLLASKQAEQIEQQEKLLVEQKPKVEFFEAVTSSKNAIDMAKVAKVLDKNIGRNKLFEFLRDRKILQRDNLPFQSYIDRGYFRVIEVKYTKPDGSTNISLKTLVHQKGVNYINKLLGEVI